MKKSTIAISGLIIICLGYMGASWYTGNQIQHQFDQEMTNLQDEINKNQGLLDVELHYENYQKGIFTTTFQLEVINNISGDKMLDENVTIYHGPFPWSQLRAGNFAPKLAATVFNMSLDSHNGSPNPSENASDKILITLNASVDYAKNVNITFNNQPITYQDEQDNQLRMTASALSLSMINGSNEVLINSKIDNLKIDNPSEQVSMNADNINLSGKYVFGKDITQSIDQQLGVKALTLTFKKELNVIANNLNFTVESSEKNLIISSKLITSVESLFFDKQNLGTGELVTSFMVGDNNSDKNVVKAAIDKFVWKTKQGDLNANLAIHVEDPQLVYLGSLTQNNVLSLDAKFDFPLKPLSYLYAQVMKSDKSEISEEDLNESSAAIQLFSSFIFNNSPIVEINFDSDDINQNGLFVDLYYSKEKQEARLKGKSLTTGQFWQSIDRNNLPNF